MADDFILPDPDDDDWAEQGTMSEPLNVEVELERFREQWHREIQQQYREYTPGGSTRSVGNSGASPQTFDVDSDEPSAEDQARFLFLQGVNAEQCGRVYDAILYYRKAVQLVPDIESRIGDFKLGRRERAREESESSLGLSDAGEVDDDLTDLIQHFQRLRIIQDEHRICQPNTDQRAVHISRLPFEVLTYIFKWVVSSDLDVHSLEQLSTVCRGFYLCARDDELWRLICMRTWGLNCGRPKTFGTYRNMYIERPHLRYNGCYIGKSTYYRQGEKGLDNYYCPFQVVNYYRYIRFFPEGKVLMLTTPDDPLTALPNLRTRGSVIQGLLTGYYKLAGDRVNLVLKRKQVVDYLPAVYRYRRQRNQQNYNSDAEQSFDAEFTVRSLNGKPHWHLTWTHYDVHTIYRSGEETIVDFELSNKAYPPLMFSRVRSFTAFSETPLQ